MTTEQKAKLTVKKLLDLTRDGKLIWKRAANPNIAVKGTDEEVGSVFVVNHAGTSFRAYVAKYQETPDGETLYWTSESRVEIIDSDGVLLWRLPMTFDTRDLLSTIQSKFVEGKLDRFLEDES